MLNMTHNAAMINTCMQYNYVCIVCCLSVLSAGSELMSERLAAERLAHLVVNLFEKLEFFLQSLTSVFSVDVQQRLVVQVLHYNTSHIHHRLNVLIHLLYCRHALCLAHDNVYLQQI